MTVEKLFKKRVEVRGEITVFLTGLLLLFLSFFAVLTEGVRVKNAQLYSERNINLALNSLFCEYYRPLWEEYHLFGLCPQELTERMQKYMTEAYRLSLKELSVSELVYNESYEGKIFLHQIAEYEKYRNLTEGVTAVKDFAGRFLTEAEGVEEEEEFFEVPQEVEESEEGEEERRKIRSLRRIWTENTVRLVLDSSEQLSTKRLKNNPLAGERKVAVSSLSPVKNMMQVKSFLQEKAIEAEEILYYRDHFKSYRTKEIPFQKKDSVLDYEKEYLLEGKASDRENLEQYLNRLLLMRTALNYLTICRDGGKCAKAYETAFAALGITGIEPLVRAGQQFILLALSYEEAVVDVRMLLNGKRVSVWKTSGEFHIAYEEMFTMNKEKLRQKAVTAKDKAGAADYEDYLCIFLGMKKQSLRQQAAWHLIETNVRLRYDEKFSFADTVFGVGVQAKFFLPGKLFRNWYFSVERHYSY